jgi:ABC-type multidrug transport system fused ATPase/permease subunit
MVVAIWVAGFIAIMLYLFEPPPPNYWLGAVGAIMAFIASGVMTFCLVRIFVSDRGSRIIDWVLGKPLEKETAIQLIILVIAVVVAAFATSFIFTILG